jgi:hypothetical protein
VSVVVCLWRVCSGVSVVCLLVCLWCVCVRSCVRSYARCICVSVVCGGVWCVCVVCLWCACGVLSVGMCVCGMCVVSVVGLNIEEKSCLEHKEEVGMFGHRTCLRGIQFSDH